jgi:hypothetical protein
MTLEETTEAILVAAEAQDLAALEEARKQREEAMAALSTLSPTIALRNAVADSIKAGEDARRALRIMKQRMRDESRRLAQIESGFLHGLGGSVPHRIDCKG